MDRRPRPPEGETIGLTTRTDDPLAPLLEEYARTRETSVRDEIVLACMDLVEHIAQRYRFTGEPVEDIAQEGFIGLINATELFDPARGVKFTTYASHAVQGAIQHYLRDKGKLIREPGWLHDLNQKINKAMARLHQQFGREPTVAEIAADLNLPDQQIADAVRARDVFRVSSLEQPAAEDHEPGYSPAEREKHRPPSDDGETLEIVDRLALEEAMQDLRQLERQVVYAFFFDDLTKTEIARMMNYSISHVSHILRRALRALKEHLLQDERRVMSRQLRSIEGQLEHFVLRVEQETIKDELTGLFNRRYILDRLDEELARCARYNHELCVCLMGIAGLADYRRQMGEPEADQVVGVAAEILIEGSRRIDRIGRYDADRFILLLPHTGEEATVLTSRIRQRMATRTFRTAGSETSFQTAFGIAVYPASGATVEDLVLAADVALLQASDPATGGIVVHQPSP